MEKSFACLAGFEHEAEMLTGYDELAECIRIKEPLTPNATYAHSVLRLHAQDEGVSVSGQESLLDSIKRGAAKVYEWIKALIKAIKDWLFGGKKKDYDEAKKNLEEEGDLVEEVRELGSKGIDGVFIEPPAKLAIKKLPAEAKVILDEAIKEEAEKPELAETLKGVRSKLIDQVLTISIRQLDMIGNAIDEIARIDPTGEALEKLGIGGTGWETIGDPDSMKQDIERIRKGAESIKDDKLSVWVKDTIAITDRYFFAMKNGTDALHRLNESAKGHSEEEKKLSRLANVLNNVGTISNALRNLIITVDSQTEKAIELAKNTLVKNALKNAKEESGSASADYINLLNYTKMKAGKL